MFKTIPATPQSFKDPGVADEPTNPTKFNLGDAGDITTFNVVMPFTGVMLGMTTLRNARHRTI